MPKFSPPKFSPQDKVRITDDLRDAPTIEVARRFVVARCSGKQGIVYGTASSKGDVFWVKHEGTSDIAIYGVDELESRSE